MTVASYYSATLFEGPELAGRLAGHAPVMADAAAERCRVKISAQANGRVARRTRPRPHRSTALRRRAVDPHEVV